MSRITNTLIAASAGTGKTYQLALRFLSLMALGVPASKMIALTFTKKAAGEFIDRILTDLARGASSETEAEKLIHGIYTCLKGSETVPGLCPEQADFVKEQLHQGVFIKLLKDTVLNLEKLNLSTIDSLFNNIIGILATEQGLSKHQIISTAQSQQEHYKAMMSLYHECIDNKELTQNLSDAFSICYAEAKEMQMDQALHELITNYHELYLDLPNQTQWGNLVDFQLEAQDLLSDMEPDEMLELATKLQASLSPDIPTPNTPRSKTLGARGLKSFNSFFESIELYLRTGKFTKNLAETHTCSKYVDIWNHHYDHLIENIYAMETRRMFERTRQARNLIESYEKHYGDLVRKQGKFLFHDTTRMLEHAKDDIENNTSAIAYRMDTNYDHWMLDEFQDTSIAQWNILLPFIQHIIEDESGQKSLFIVGDGKQSIYQWRGGEPKLFESLQSPDTWGQHLQLAPMNVSYRSSQAVLDMANAVCDYALTASNAYPKAISRWKYEPHRAAKTNLIGFTQILQNQDEDLSDKESILHGIVDLLQKINPNNRRFTHKDQSLSCAILVNTKKEALLIKNWVNTHAPEQEIEICEDITAGIDSPLGQSLLDFFTWLLHPSDKFAQNHFIHSPLQILFEGHENMATAWTSWKMRLEMKGYGHTMRLIKQKLHTESLSTFHQSRLNFWITEADRFDQMPDSLQSWINHMSLQSKQANPPEGVIQIMTVHKSKGLEFDVVILPVLPSAKNFTDKTHLKSIISKNETGKKDAVLLLESSIFAQTHPKLNKFVENWEEEQQYEGFCKLYVALTRAVHATYVLIPAPRKAATDSISFRSIFENAIAHFGQESESSNDLMKSMLSFGQENWYEINTIAFQKSEETPLIPFLLPKPQRTLSKRTASKHSSLPNEQEKQALEFGTTIHKELAKITWITPNSQPNFLHLNNSIREYLEQFFSHDDIIKLFTPCSQQSKVYCEQHVDMIYGENLFSCCIDRLVVTGDHAKIYDYKTDHYQEEESLKKQHYEQLHLYKNAVAKALNLQEANIETFVVSTYTGKIISI